MRIKNFPSVESIDGSQDALVIEQTDGDVDKSRKVSPAQIKQYVLNDMDEVPTEDSENPVKSGGVFSKLEKCWKLDAGTVIPDNSDLNNYKTPGNYYHLTANVSTVSNIPDNKGFRLTVLLDLYDPAFVEQIFNPIGSYKIYKRYYSTSNAWTDWKVVEDVIGDLSQTGLTGDSVAEQLTEINTALDSSKIAVFTQTFNNVTIANAWGSLYESSQQRFDISSLGLQSPPKAVYIGLKQAQNAVMFELLSPLATSIPFHFIRPNQMTTPINITATALVIY